MSDPRQSLGRPLSIAPMMKRTDRHFRYVIRCITRETLLYSEMVTAGAILYGPREALLAFHPREHPLVLQIGTDSPEDAARVASIAAAAGYDEINLNVGCPSDRVQRGRFGACLMAEPEQVRDIVAAMAEASGLPVSVKHRIGIDDLDDYAHLLSFVDVVASSDACARFSVHARKAWLKGLSPKQNRSLPPLRYADVFRLKRERPDLVIEINGGVSSLAETSELLGSVDAVMIGRAAYDRPMMLAAADRDIFGKTVPLATIDTVIEDLQPYLEALLVAGGRVQDLTRHMMGLFHGQAGASAWRRYLAEQHHLPGVGPEILVEARNRQRESSRAAGAFAAD